MAGGQYGEDRILNFVFKGKRNGLVVDVGAANGVDGSNSWMLIHRYEWRGILIEPEPAQYADLKMMYQENLRVECVNVAIDKEAGVKDFYCCGQLSTLREEYITHAKALHNAEYTQTKVETVTLTALLTNYFLSEKNKRDAIDFMSIDAEGMNYDVWLTLDLNIFLPKLVCIEGSGYAMHGYKELCRTPGNTLYLREDLCDPL